MLGQMLLLSGNKVARLPCCFQKKIFKIIRRIINILQLIFFSLEKGSILFLRKRCEYYRFVCFSRCRIAINPSLPINDDRDHGCLRPWVLQLLVHNLSLSMRQK